MSLQSVKAVVLSTVKYGDQSVILKCYTDIFGLQSYLISKVGGKRTQVKPAHILPLTLLEIETTQSPTRNLQRIKELKCSPPLIRIHSEIVRSAMAMFIAEVISRAVREEHHPDKELFQFLYETISSLDTTEEVPLNLLPFFLVELCEKLGFSLRISDPGGYLNNPEPPDPSGVLKTFLETRQSAIPYPPLSGIQRRNLIESLLHFLSVQIPEFGTVKSFSILQTVFS